MLLSSEPVCSSLYVKNKHILNLNGTGVVGLTTALAVLERGGYSVTIVADTFPSDPKSIRYTSLWAVRYNP